MSLNSEAPNVSTESELQQLTCKITICTFDVDICRTQSHIHPANNTSLVNVLFPHAGGKAAVFDRLDPILRHFLAMHSSVAHLALSQPPASLVPQTVQI